jgi:hypothetical protein
LIAVIAMLMLGTATLMNILKFFAIFCAMEVLVFLFGYVIEFAIGVTSGGVSEGFRLASGVFYSWFGFVLIGLLGTVVCATILMVKRKMKTPPNV